MNKLIFGLGILGMGTGACANVGPGEGALGEAAASVVLDVRCTVDADCPSDFECETEVEHGAETSYCVSHDSESAAAGQCPPGYELEAEHEGTFCKEHGGGSDDASAGGSGHDDASGGGGQDGASEGSGGASGDAADDAGAGSGGGDDPAGDAGGEAGAACASDADCGPGLECESEVEDGVTTSTCKAHGGGG